MIERIVKVIVLWLLRSFLKQYHPQIVKIRPKGKPKAATFPAVGE